MKRLALAASLTLLAAAVSLAVAQTVSPTPATPTAPTADAPREMTDVPVRRVVLFSSGVGFFQHSGKVTGNAATELRFKTDQINDILKTLVVSDTSANGQVKSITYGSQNPVARTLKSFQIDISTNPTLAGILNQIRGTKISVSASDEKIEGTVLGVEEKDHPVGNPGQQQVVKESFVNLITSEGIRSISLDAVKKLAIEDADLQKELDQALTALAQARDKDKKPVIVNFDGTGERPVTVAYLVETPVWKTSYRLILPDPTSKEGNAALLGWAIVENQTDNDWNNITLDLVGGRPISFIQNLYQPLYVPRPVVAPKTYASLTPQTYDDGVQELAATPPANQPVFPGGARATGGGGFGGVGGVVAGGGGRGGRGGVAPVAASAAPTFDARLAAEDAAAPVDYAQGVKSIADAAKVGEMFQYSVKGVSLPRQRSSMIPIITASVPFDRVSIYNRAVLAKNPLLGVRLKNQSGNYLLAGPLTVLDKIKRADGTIADSYAGDADVDDVPPGQERLLSYGIDQDVLVDMPPREPVTRLITGSIVKGVLNLKYTDTVEQKYILENRGDNLRHVLIEDPLEYGYELKSPAKALEKTDKVYRFQQDIDPKKTVLFTIIKERPRGERFELLAGDLGTLEIYSTTGEIPQKVKDILKTTADKRKALLDLQRQIQQKQNERNLILQDEATIRANIQAAPSNSKVYQDSVNDLSAKETDRKQTDTDIKSLQTSLDKARADLEAYVSDTNAQ